MDELNASEWDLLEVLWKRRRATAGAVAAVLAPSRGWAYSTVKTLLDRMKAKGLVRARRVGSVWEYEPVVAAAAARRSAWKAFLATAFGGALDPALRFLAHEAPLTLRQRARLRKLLDETGGRDE